MTMRAVVIFVLLWSIVIDGGATDASTDDENVALSGIATQSSDYTGLMHARNAIDGNRNTNTGFYSCAFTNLETNPWWRLRLQKEYAIDSVTITSSISYLLNGAEIRIGNSLDNNGNSNPRCAVITSISLAETRTFSCRGMRGRYVNVFLPASRNLVLCEVEVKPSTVVENVALRGKATQSSQYNFEGSAEKAIDGNLSPELGDGSCTHSKPQTNPWWRVDLLDVYKVESVTITNRGDGSPERINGAEIRVGKSDSSIGNNNPVCATVSSISAGASTTFQCHNMEGRYVNIIIPGSNKILTLCEVEVNASPI